MPGEDIYSWSVTAANNGNSDSAIEWREGQTRASVNNSSRAEMAAHAKHRKLTDGSISTTNVGNAYAFTSGIGYTTVPTGMRVTVKIATDTNTGSSTLNMDGIGDVTIKDDQGVELHGGELVANAYTEFLYDGTNWIFLYSRAFFVDLITNSDGIIISTQVFTTPGAATYTPSADEVQCVIVECIGGGGGGGGAFAGGSSQWYVGGGGGSGAYSRKLLTRTEVGTSQTVTIGVAGGGGFGGTGATGGDTSFGTLCIAKGGFGGGGGSPSAAGVGGSGGSTAGGVGDVVFAGAPGQSGYYGGGLYAGIGYAAGGTSAFGGGAPTSSAAAANYGGGGGGAVATDAINFSGSNGSAGIVIVTEYGGRGAPGRDGSDGTNGAIGPQGPIGPPGPAGAGTGDVLVHGTPVAGQVATWFDTSHVQGVDAATLIPSGFGTGDIKATFKVTPDTGWVMLDDGTIGNASSGASNRHDADTQALFLLLWANVSDANAPVSGGRTTALNDFTLNKTIRLPKALGRAMMGAGAGTSLTTRALGAAIGAETETQTIAKMAAHTHTYSLPLAFDTNANPFDTANPAIFWTQGPASGTTGSQGGTTPLDIMQPSFAVNFMCKL